MSSKFMLGDRVEVTGALFNGDHGVVVKFYDEYVGVRFDTKHSALHDLGGDVPDGFGWYCNADNLRHVGDNVTDDLTEARKLRDHLRAKHVDVKKFSIVRVDGETGVVTSTTDNDGDVYVKFTDGYGDYVASVKITILEEAA